MTPAKPPEDLGHYITIDELSAQSRLSKSSLYRLKDDGLLPYFQRRRGGKLLFPPDALEQAMARMQQRAESPPSAPPSPPTEATALPPAKAAKPLSGRRAAWESGPLSS